MATFATATVCPLAKMTLPVAATNCDAPLREHVADQPAATLSKTLSDSRPMVIGIVEPSLKYPPPLWASGKRGPPRARFDARRLTRAQSTAHGIAAG